MTHTELRSVDSLRVADMLEFADDVRLFRVMRIEGRPGAADAKLKMHLRSVDGKTQVVMVRSARDSVRVVRPT